MNKQELIKHLAESADVSKTQAESVLNALVDTVQNRMKNNEDTTISGLGTFSVSERAARSGRNPSTGESIDIAAKTVPKFSAAKALKDAAAE
ncbi:MAG: HU family DNA-binding protein [Burkholderiaceae bacterium]|nr:HU family DNA-binding protein [Burkholderiaceae bacterium]